MSLYNLAGYTILVAIFAALFFGACRLIGFKAAAAVFLASVALVSVLYLATHLIKS
jgi:hypothetical protein